MAKNDQPAESGWTDANRDAYALVIAVMRRDEAGAAAILGNCDTRQVAQILADLAADQFEYQSPGLGLEARAESLARRMREL